MYFYFCYFNSDTFSNIPFDSTLKMKNFLLYLLVTLIALQSVTAFADVYQQHQSGNRHAEFSHDHQLPATPDNDSLQSGTAMLFADQIHYQQNSCHCHCAAHLFLSSGSVLLPVVHAVQEISEYQFTFISRNSPPSQRPPIA